MKIRKGLSVLLSLVMVLGVFPLTTFAVGNSDTEHCTHHTEHTSECGYQEASLCIHEHDDDCYVSQTVCTHTHNEECEVECSHVCSEENGCTTKELNCTHTHDEACGYAEEKACAFVCEACAAIAASNQEQVDTAQSTVVMDTPYAMNGLENTEGYVVGDFTVGGGTYGTDYKFENNALIILSDTELTIANTNPTAATSQNIQVAENVSANFTLAGVNIKTSGGSEPSACPLYLNKAGTCTVILADESNNILDGSATTNMGPGLWTPNGKLLTIRGNGTLTAKGGRSWPGIGRHSDTNLHIESGTIIAVAGSNAAGIGGSWGNTGGNIKISGGYVQASGGSCGIGGGRDKTNQLNFSTGTPGSAVIVTSSIGNTNGSGAWNCILSTDNGNGLAVYGNMNLKQDLTIQNSTALTIPDGSTLTVFKDVNLINNGTITNKGTITNNGTFTNDGKIINNGTLPDDIVAYYTIDNQLANTTLTGVEKINGMVCALQNSTVTVDADDGYVLNQLKVNNEEITGNSFIMPTSSVTLTGTVTRIFEIDDTVSKVINCLEQNTERIELNDFIEMLKEDTSVEYSLKEGSSLPEGLNLENGIISGVYNGSANVDTTIVVTAGGATAELTLTFTHNAPIYTVTIPASVNIAQDGGTFEIKADAVKLGDTRKLTVSLEKYSGYLAFDEDKVPYELKAGDTDVTAGTNLFTAEGKGLTPQSASASLSISVTGTPKYAENYTDTLVFHIAETEKGENVVYGGDDSNIPTTKVAYAVQPTYTVTIPSEVRLGETATISAENVVLKNGKQLKVTLTGTSGENNAFTLSNGSNGLLTYEVKRDNESGTAVAVGDVVMTVNPANAAFGQQIIYFTEPSKAKYSGEYSGTVTFTIAVEEVQ